MISTLISTLGGALFGQVQNVLEKKQETKRYKIQQELANEKQKIEDNTKIELLRANVDIAKYESIIAINKRNEAKIKQEQEEYSNFTNAAVKLNKTDKGLGKYIRPMYSIGFLYCL